MQSQLLSVLIVDDEVPIREELKLFDWEANGAVLIGEAENGQEALQFCREYIPNVVITDITMPVMDGIQLSHHIKHEFPQVQIIMLTAYRDFQYAKEAIKIGALDYLVKVMWDEEALVNVLHKAREVIAREKFYLLNAQEQIRWQKSEILAQFLKSDQVPYQQIYPHITELGIILSFPLYFAKLFIDSETVDVLFVDRALQRWLSEMEQQRLRAFIWMPIKAGQYLLIFNERDKDQTSITSELNDLISNLHAKINEHLSYIDSEIELLALISTPVMNEQLFGDNIKEVIFFKYSKFYETTSQVIHMDEHSFKRLTQDITIEIESLKRKSIQDIYQLIRFLQGPFIDWCTHNKIEPEEVIQLLWNWRNEWVKYYQINQDIAIDQNQLKSISLSKVILSFVNELKKNSNYESKYRYEVRETINFIEKNIAETMTITFLAENVGLSSNYLSRIFRDEIGQSLPEFITDRRMDKAIQLLQHTNLKVYEVAEAVGIPSYRYFSVLFRKRTGLTPKEFRK